MQAILGQCRDAVAEIGRGCATTEVCKEECLKLGRFVAKVALILAELELQLHADDSLTNSEALFLALEATAAALTQAASLVRQCAATTAARIWPLEDSIEFQSVGLALLESISSAYPKINDISTFSRVERNESINLDFRPYQARIMLTPNSPHPARSRPAPQRPRRCRSACPRT